MEEIKQIFTANLNDLMRKNGENITELSDRIGIPTSTISDWKNGKKLPRAGSLQKLADHYNINLSELTTSQPAIPENITKIDNNHLINIPIIGEIACGEPITAEQNIEGYRTEVAENIPSGNVFFLKCRGTSMEPTISNGAYVLIKPQPTVEDNEIAAVLVDDQTEATLKRVHHQGENIILVGDNPDFIPIVLNKNYPGKIIGKAIKVSFDL